MADFYGLEFVGGPDGTKNPPRKLDFRMVGGKKRRVRATKPTTQAFAAGDRLYIGKLPANSLFRSIAGCSDTSFGSTTISVGTTGTPAKYVNAKTLTATDVPTALGPKAAALFADPVTVDEDLWVTFGVATLVAGSVAGFDWEYVTNN